jgi:CrcB protein
MTHPLHWLLLAIAGGFGTLLRAGCTTLAVRLAGDERSWAAEAATLAVNVAGSFAFGLIYGLSESRQAVPPAWQPIILAGLLGGFTTYSSFAFQSLSLLTGGRLVTAGCYLAATTALALAAVWAGLRLAGG